MTMQNRTLYRILKSLLVLALLVVPAMATMSSPMNARDLPGNNMEYPGNGWNLLVSSAQECADLCDAAAGCAAATYVIPGVQSQVPGKGNCLLKNAVPTDTECGSCISFVKIPSGSGSWGCTDPTGAKADFTASPTTGPAPLTVTFTDASVGASQYAWLFGDGQSSTSPSPTHQYTAAGTYNVQLAIQTGCGHQFNKFGTITVTPAQSTTGYLSVITSPSGATLYVDTASQGTTPKAGIILTPGSHEVTISKTGYSDYTQTVTIEAGKTKELTVTLTSDQQPATTGTMTITSTPSGAAVFLDNTAKGTTPLTLKELAPKTYSLVLKKTGYPDFKASAKVEAGKTTTVNAVLGTTQTATATATATTQPGAGSLSVVTNPAGAEVYIDGGLKGVSPTTIPGLSAGTHNLMLKMNGYQDLMTTVTIPAGQTTEYNTALAKVKTPGFEALFAIAALCAVFFIGRKGK